jgi:predicted nucleotidyltransferase
MSPDLPPLVQRTLQRLIRAFAPERIVLFGSYAKGMVHDRSDVDLLVITSLGGDPAFHQRRARQLAADCFPPIDVVFATTADVASASSAKSPFLLSILGSGITIYTRPCRLAGRGPVTCARRARGAAAGHRGEAALFLPRPLHPPPTPT